MTTTHEAVFLRGWAAIEKATGMDQKDLRGLCRDHGFPIVYVGGRPITTPELMREWVRSMVHIQDRPAHDAGEVVNDGM